MEIQEPKRPLIFTLNTLTKIRLYDELMSAYREMNGELKYGVLALTFPVQNESKPNNLPRKRKFF